MERVAHEEELYDNVQLNSQYLLQKQTINEQTTSRSITA